MAGEGSFALLQQLSINYYASRCLHLVADLGIADLIERSTPVTALADQTGSDADALGRVLRLLSSLGIFDLKEGVVSQTEASALLQSDHPFSMRDYVRMSGLPVNWKSAELLAHTVRTGESAASAAAPGGFWGALSGDPEQGRIFNAAMAAKAGAQIGALCSAFDFTHIEILTDVGGGQGHFLRAVLAASPRTQGVLFDLPHVVEDARTLGDEQGRLRFVPGDFFQSALPESPAYCLMEVLHDWGDEPALAILRAVRRAAPAGARLLVMEAEVPSGNTQDWSKLMDVVMMALFAGRQRTRDEYRGLLERAGFELSQVIDTGAGISIFEALAI